MSEKQGYSIAFNRWFKVGFPFMLVTVAVGMVIWQFNYITVLGNDDVFNLMNKPSPVFVSRKKPTRKKNRADG